MVNNFSTKFQLIISMGGKKTTMGQYHFGFGCFLSNKVVVSFFGTFGKWTKINIRNISPDHSVVMGIFLNMLSLIPTECPSIEFWIDFNLLPHQFVLFRDFDKKNHLLHLATSH